MGKKADEKPLDIQELIKNQGDRPFQMPILSYNINEFEDEALKEASKTISSLESSLASWDALKNKPQNQEVVYKRHRWFRDALVEWMTEMLRSRKSGGEDFFTRLRRLDRLVEICNQYRGNK